MNENEETAWEWFARVGRARYEALHAAAGSNAERKRLSHASSVVAHRYGGRPLSDLRRDVETGAVLGLPGVGGSTLEGLQALLADS
jgi:hypothetical protein